MPLKDEHFTKGNLFINFNIVFPADGSLTPEQLAVLKATLPGPTTEPVVDDEMERVTVATLNFLKSQRNWMRVNRRSQLRILISLRKNSNMMRLNPRSQQKTLNFLKSQRNWMRVNRRSQLRILNSLRKNPNMMRPNL